MVSSDFNLAGFCFSRGNNMGKGELKKNVTKWHKRYLMYPESNLYLGCPIPEGVGEVGNARRLSLIFGF